MKVGDHNMPQGIHTVEIMQTVHECTKISRERKNEEEVRYW